MKKVNRITFDKIKAQFDILKMRAAYVAAEQYLIEEAERNYVEDPSNPIMEIDAFGNMKQITVREMQIAKLTEQLEQLIDAGNEMLKIENYEELAKLHNMYARISSQLRRLRSGI